METVENYLGNALWVSLSESTQQQLANAFRREVRYTFRLDLIDKLAEKLGKLADPQLCEGYSWDRFPHPASWPKSHSNPPALVYPTYSSVLHDYTGITGAYMMVNERGGPVYRNLMPRYLLVYSNLLCPESTFRSMGPPISVDQLEELIAWLNTPELEKKSEFVRRMLNRAAKALREATM